MSSWDGGGTWDGGGVWDGGGPTPAVVQTCPKCGSAVFCGGPLCPSAALPLAPDGVPMIEEVFISVIVWNFITGQFIVQVA